jgi:hypothetical protein
MAITLAGGTTVGNAGHGATVKPYGFVRVQFDASGTYETGGYADFETFVKAITGLTKITMVDAVMTMPGGAYNLYWDQVNDKLVIFVGSTQVQVANAASVTLTNAEMLVIYE